MAKKKYRSLQQIFQMAQPASGRGADLFSTTKLSEPAAHLCIYEDAESHELPTIIVPANNDLESFFADVATYFPNFVPISAYAHVLDETAFEASQNKFEIGASGAISKPELSTYIGLILGDALSIPRPANQRSMPPSYASCKRTLAFCIARSAVLHPELSTNRISSRWLHIRQLSGMDASTNAAASICWAADLVGGKPNPTSDNQLNEFIESLALYFRKKISRDRVSQSFLYMYPGLHSIPSLQYEPYEKRIEAFSAVINAVRSESRGPGLDSMCIAFFCNLILPGSLAHTALIERLIQDLPDSMLWYGIFAGCSDEFSLTAYFGGVGQKLFRDLVAPFDYSHRPTCDISIDEYDVLARVPMRSDVIKPTQAKAVLVSLYPGVDVYVRSALEEDDGGTISSLSSRLLERDERVNQARRLLWQAEQILRGDQHEEPAERTPTRAVRKTRQSKG